MGTGAKIGIVLGLLLIVIGFVRFLDDDIANKVSKPDPASDGGADELAKADGGTDPTAVGDEVSTFGVDTPDPTPVVADEGGADPSENDSAASDDNEGEELLNAGLRSVRREDHSGGFLGTAHPSDPVVDGPDDSEETRIDDDPDLVVADSTDTANSETTAPPTEDWTPAGPSLTNPDEVFSLLQGNGGGDSTPVSGDVWDRILPAHGSTDTDRVNRESAAVDDDPDIEPRRDDVARSGARPASTTYPGSDSTSPAEDRDIEDSVDRGSPAPDSSRSREAAAVAGFPKTHTVEEGDRLWNIAAEHYENPLLWKEILAANPSLGDGSRLKVGSKITIPAPSKSKTVARSATPRAAPVNRAPTTSTPGSYTVAKGDSLYVIAERLLGQGTRWPEIAKANPSVDPDHLKIGVKLTIPPK